VAAQQEAAVAARALELGAPLRGVVRVGAGDGRRRGRRRGRREFGEEARGRTGREPFEEARPRDRDDRDDRPALRHRPFERVERARGRHRVEAAGAHTGEDRPVAREPTSAHAPRGPRGGQPARAVLRERVEPRVGRRVVHPSDRADQRRGRREEDEVVEREAA
jgi:hypothetical protein